MKKILLSMIMLCTAMSAWSYETESVTITCNGENTSPFTVDATMASDGKDADPYWEIRNGYDFILKAPTGYYVTKVEFSTTDGKVEYCDKLNKYQMNVWVSPNNADLQYYDAITFSNPEGSIAKATSISVTYHRCEGTYYAASPSTCYTHGTTDYWACDCGRIYSDADCTHETNMASLAKDFDPTNHPDALEEHARVEATCTTAGNVQYWHCNHCDKNFGSKDGKGEAIPDVTISMEQGSHNNLSFFPQKDATCTESGVAMNHYHCSDCGKNFEEQACATQITEDVTIPAINHKNKTFTDYVAPTTDKEGNVAYWHCPDCDKYFGDEGCSTELTEWTLEKLVNMLHFNFKGSAVPVETEHYMNAAKFKFTGDGDVILTVNGESVTYDKDMIDKVKFSNGTPTARIKANEDPDKKGTYYSTFYSSLESYAVPEGFKAYRGEISKDGTKLNLTSVKDGVMQRGEGYILRGATSNDSIKVTENTAGGVSGNVLLGTDVPIAALGANEYALSLGQKGVGFYLWNGKTIGANKAYLTLADPNIKALTFVFEEEGTTGIEAPSTSPKGESPVAYDLRGLRVSDGYKGIVIKNGKKALKK